jgi:hypothetical protein
MQDRALPLHKSMIQSSATMNSRHFFIPIIPLAMISTAQAAEPVSKLPELYVFELFLKFS